MSNAGHGAAIFEPREAGRRNTSGLTFQPAGLIHHHRHGTTSAGDDRRHCGPERMRYSPSLVLQQWSSRIHSYDFIWMDPRARRRKKKSPTEHLQAAGYLRNSSHVNCHTSVQPRVGQLSSLDLQHLTALQHRHPSCARKRAAIFVPSNGWEEKRDFTDVHSALQTGENGASTI